MIAFIQFWFIEQYQVKVDSLWNYLSDPKGIPKLQCFSSGISLHQKKTWWWEVGQRKLIVEVHLLLNRISRQMLYSRCIEKFYLKEPCQNQIQFRCIGLVGGENNQKLPEFIEVSIENLPQLQHLNKWRKLSLEVVRNTLEKLFVQKALFKIT